jgi:hypothetical protein
MAGYSGTPLPRKLGIKEDARVGLIDAPKDFARTLGKLPPGVEVRTQARGRFDVAVMFVTRSAELERRFPSLLRALDPDGGLWVAWPKRASGVPTDLRSTSGRRRKLRLCGGGRQSHGRRGERPARGSGLRFCYRVADRGARRSRKGA